MSLVRSLGRVSLASMFIFGGYNSFSEPEPRSKQVEKAGLPQPYEATVVNGAIMMVAGTALALDFLPKLSALALIGSLIPTTFVGHPFWREDDPARAANQRTQFLKNVAMLGGLLVYLGS